MICFLPSLCGLDGTGANEAMPASVATVAEHIIYAGTAIGYEHVGIGSDFDGMLEGPLGLDDVSAYPSLVVELLSKGVSAADVQLVLGQNILRVLSEVERYAAGQQRGSSQQLCDHIGPVWTEAQRSILVAKGAERSSKLSHLALETPSETCDGPLKQYDLSGAQ